MTKMSSIDEVMYSCGMEILHPGGLEKSLEMAETCKISRESKILDIGCGKGATAIRLAGIYGCSITCIDLSENMIRYAEQAAAAKQHGGKIEFIRQDAHQLPFRDNTFDIVLVECTTVLMDKDRAFNEFLRVVKAGGYVADLEMTWKKEPPRDVIDRASYIWDGFSTKTFDGWHSFFIEKGLSDIKMNDFSARLDNMKKYYMSAMGLKGILKMMSVLLKNRKLRKSMAVYDRFFKENRGYIGYGYFVGRKAQE